MGRSLQNWGADNLQLSVVGSGDRGCLAWQRELSFGQAVYVGRQEPARQLDHARVGADGGFVLALDAAQVAEIEERDRIRWIEIDRAIVFLAGARAFFS